MIEPGLLQIFRLYNGIYWGLLMLAVCGASSEAASEDPQSFFAIISLLQTTFLLVYLGWGRLRRWLGRFYLPIALTVASVGPVLAQVISVMQRVDAGMRGDLAATDSGGLILLLFIPLLLVSAQYTMRTMLFYVFSLSFLEIALMIHPAAAGGPALRLTIDQVVIRAMVFLMAGYTLVRLMAAQRQQRRALAAANQRLKQYAATQEQLAVSQERNRMARDLHDTLAHTLSAVSVQLEALATQIGSDGQSFDLTAAHNTVGLLRNLTRSGLQETRQALRALRSDPLADLGLGIAVQTLAASTAERAGLQLISDIPDVTITVDDHAERAGTEQHIYRIAEEALNNVLRHANAAHVWVRLRRDGHRLVLQIRDDGIGFKPEDATQDGHYGLTGMHERAELCGGVLHVTSTPEKGTMIKLEVVL